MTWLKFTLTVLWRFIRSSGSDGRTNV